MARTTLWLGGSSALARTYCNRFANEENGNIILLGKEPSPPAWLSWKNVSYMACDLSKLGSSADKVPIPLLNSLKEVNRIIVGIRPPLLTSMNHEESWKYNEKLLQGMEAILKEALSKTKIPKSVIHISSVAAVDHLQEQIMVSEEEVSPLLLPSLASPYDRFKLQSECILDRLASGSSSVVHAHLRISAIFSDDESCIQSQAMSLQAHIGPYAPMKIDCNSALNVCHAVHLMLTHLEGQSVSTEDESSVSKIFYYTRPSALQEPVSYGQYLAWYRDAHKIPSWQVFATPMFVVTGFVKTFHFLTSLFGKSIPYLESIDYLLQVSSREHSFNNQHFLALFPKITSVEESIVDCFIRRQLVLKESINCTATQRWSGVE